MSDAPAWSEWPICHVTSISDPGAHGFLIGDGDWPFRGFVVRNGDSVHAYANICPHARHPLDLLPDAFLSSDGGMIRCGSHGALFKTNTGECVVGPCVGANLLRLDLRIDADDMVQVRAPVSMRDERLSAWTGV
jgi:nitrite reductase/ring-hydroxylating ferredoxin subunit